MSETEMTPNQRLGLEKLNLADGEPVQLAIRTGTFLVSQGQAVHVPVDHKVNRGYAVYRKAPA